MTPTKIVFSAGLGLVSTFRLPMVLGQSELCCGALLRRMKEATKLCQDLHLSCSGCVQGVEDSGSVAES